MKTIAQNLSIRQRIDAAKSKTNSRQAHRLVDYLYHYGPAMTDEVCQSNSWRFSG